MTVHPDQADPKWKHNQMTFRDFVQLPLYVNGIYSSIDTQMLKTPNIILFRLENLENGRNLDTGTLKKNMGDTFSECCTKTFKAKLLSYVNEVIF